MAVNSNISGLKYFEVRVEAIRENVGKEAIVFVHERGGVQLSLNVAKADFDVVSEAEAGFNVLPGDIVKFYIVDNLTDEADHNPTLLQ